jgi:hypothetical protein
VRKSAAVGFMRFGIFLVSGGSGGIVKSKGGPRKIPKDSSKRKTRANTLRPQTKSRTNTLELEIQARVLDRPLRFLDLPHAESQQKESALNVGALGTVNAARNAVIEHRTEPTYPVSVRQANALLVELGHSWIDSQEIKELLTSLRIWLTKDK